MPLNGTTHVVFEPLDFIARLAALVPKPRVHYTRSCMMGFRHLNYLQRCQILALWKAGFNQTQIAKEAGEHKSTICRELKRNNLCSHCFRLLDL
jgi:hypothetical protein